MTLFTLAHVHSCTAVNCISGTSAMIHSCNLLVCQSSIHMSAIWVTLQQLQQVQYQLANMCSILYIPVSTSTNIQTDKAPGSNLEAPQQLQACY